MISSYDTRRQGELPQRSKISDTPRAETAIGRWNLCMGAKREMLLPTFGETKVGPPAGVQGKDSHLLIHPRHNQNVTTYQTKVTIISSRCTDNPSGVQVGEHFTGDKNPKIGGIKFFYKKSFFSTKKGCTFYGSVVK